MRKKRIIRGFTLAELLVAAALLALAVTGLLQLLIVCLISNTTASNQVVASNDAQYVLEAMKGLPYADVCSYTVPSFTNLNDENVYVFSCSQPEAGITQVTVTVEWKERNATTSKSLQLSTRIAETSE